MSKIKDDGGSGYFGKSPLNRQLQFKARQHTERILNGPTEIENIFSSTNSQRSKATHRRGVAHRDWFGSACLRVMLKIMTLIDIIS